LGQAQVAVDVAMRAPARHVDAPMLDIPTARDSEPQMRIPQPPGWERTNELNDLDEASGSAW
jgi:hypothetical protein